MRKLHVCPLDSVASLMKIRMDVPPLDMEPLWGHLVGPRCKTQAQGRSSRVSCEKASRAPAAQSGRANGLGMATSQGVQHAPSSQYSTSTWVGSLTARLSASVPVPFQRP